MGIRYLEVVTHDVDSVIGTYEQAFGLEFGAEDSAMGQARCAARPDGSLVGIRKPLADHEEPIIRSYVEVEDIALAVKIAEASGATVAYPPTPQGNHGTFAIIIHGEVQHGLWQR